MIRFLLLFLTLCGSLDLSARSPRTRQRTDGVLDSYPGAAAAYVLRPAGRWAMYNPVLRARRSNDNAEREIMWHELHDGTITTWTGANDGFVTIWYDQSGNGRDATQVTPAQQPRIVDLGVLESDGLKFIKDGDGLSLDFIAWTPTGPNTNFLIFRSSLISNSTSLALLSQYSSNVDGRTWITQNQLNKYSYFSKGSPGLSAELGDISTDTHLLTVIKSEIPEVSTYRDGIELSSNISASSISVYQRTTYIGGGPGSMERSPLGYIPEIIIYQNDQSAHRAAIESNIANHYGITLP